MISIKRINQKEPITHVFKDLRVGEMFVDLEDLDLMLKISENDAMMIGSGGGDTFGYDPDCSVQLCNVDIQYTPRYI